MGFYDREYVRDGPSYLGSWVRSGQVCKWLVVINTAVFLVQLVTARPPNDYGPVTSWLAMKPVEVFEQLQIWRLLTGAFLHSPDNWMHILWNMLFLWFFGRSMEDHYGRREFLLFYLVSGVIGNLAWGLTATWGLSPDVARQVAPQLMGIGASGAVTGVLVLCTMHHPHRTMLLFFVLPVPLWAFTLIFVGGDLLYFLRGPHTTGVAVAAHLGGAAFGFLYYRLGWRISGFVSDLLRRASRSRKPRLRLYSGEPEVHAPARAAERLDEQLEARTDAVLAKVARSGLDSLTPEERLILLKASEQYRKRRS